MQKCNAIEQHANAAIERKGVGERVGKLVRDPGWRDMRHRRVKAPSEIKKGKRRRSGQKKRAKSQTAENNNRIISSKYAQLSREKEGEGEVKKRSGQQLREKMASRRESHASAYAASMATHNSDGITVRLNVYTVNVAAHCDHNHAISRPVYAVLQMIRSGRRSDRRH